MRVPGLEQEGEPLESGDLGRNDVPDLLCLRLHLVEVGIVKGLVDSNGVFEVFNDGVADATLVELMSFGDTVAELAKDVGK